MTFVSIEPWGRDDGPLLVALLGDPEMTRFLGGPESDEKLSLRQGRYEVPGSRQYKVLVDGQPCGYVGYWEHEWQGAPAWEAGWSVLPAFQGRGVATAAMRLLLEVVRSDDAAKSVHAFPSVENAASNALCQKLGFKLVGPLDLEYPPGQPLRCNDWRLDNELSGAHGASG